jgi:4-aminobutyrate aminotransferase-like enzyme
VIEQDCGGRPAAIIIEPIQGTAGNVVPPDGFLREVRHVADEYDTLLVADEMITGFGRTGVMFGCNHDEVVPDIMTVGKGMGGGFPVSAVISTDKIMAAKPFSLPSASSSSYGGNPLAATAALVTIQTIVDENLAQNAVSVGEFFRDGLREIESRRGMIANIRGRGLLVGFDLVDDRKQLLPKANCVEFFKACLAEGLIMMSYTPRVRVHPPLILRRAEAEQALAVIDDVLSEMTAC